MNIVLNPFKTICDLLACIGELLGYLLRFVRAFFQSRASLAARLVAAEILCWPTEFRPAHFPNRPGCLDGARSSGKLWPH